MKINVILFNQFKKDLNKRFNKVYKIAHSDAI